MMGHFEVSPDLGAHAPAVEHGQHHVKQHEVRLSGLEFLHSLAAVRGDADLKTLLFKIHPNEVGNVVVVFYHKDVARHGRSLRLSVIFGMFLL